MQSDYYKVDPNEMVIFVNERDQISAIFYGSTSNHYHDILYKRIIIYNFQWKQLKLILIFKVTQILNLSFLFQRRLLTLNLVVFLILQLHFEIVW